MTVEQLTRDALALPPEQRASLAHTLLESLDTDTDPIDEVEQAWAEEIRFRLKRMRSGQVKFRPWEDVRRDIDRALAEQRGDA